MEKQLVLARYEENLDWVIENNLVDKTKIYNKGSDLSSKFINVTKLSNVGREAHTYLHHIIFNYHKLADFTYFCQGNPFDHSLNFVEKFNNLEINKFTYLGDFSHKIYKDYLYDESVYDKSLPLVASTLNLTSFLPNVYEFKSGAIFAVPKKNILNRSLAYYEEAISFVDSDISSPAAHAFERLWEFIFSVRA
jgi:hypothetical protein